MRWAYPMLACVLAPGCAEASAGMPSLVAQQALQAGPEILRAVLQRAPSQAQLAQLGTQLEASHSLVRAQLRQIRTMRDSPHLGRALQMDSGCSLAAQGYNSTAAHLSALCNSTACNLPALMESACPGAPSGAAAGLCTQDGGAYCFDVLYGIFGDETQVEEAAMLQDVQQGAQQDAQPSEDEPAAPAAPNRLDHALQMCALVSGPCLATLDALR